MSLSVIATSIQMATETTMQNRAQAWTARCVALLTATYTHMVIPKGHAIGNIREPSIWQTVDELLRRSIVPSHVPALEVIIDDANGNLWCLDNRRLTALKCFSPHSRTQSCGQRVSLARSMGAERSRVAFSRVVALWPSPHFFVYSTSETVGTKPIWTNFNAHKAR